jgi:hypothetical protein
VLDAGGHSVANSSYVIMSSVSLVSLPVVLNCLERILVILSGTLAPISKSESLDFCVISESESTVVPSSLSVNTQYALSRTCFFFPSWVTKLKKLSPPFVY